VLRTIDFLISFGEITAGLFYVFIGMVFIAQAAYSKEVKRTAFRVWVAAIFIVGGLEELADSVLHEGSGALAYWAQGLLTAAQVTTGGMCLWALNRAKMMTRDFQA